MIGVETEVHRDALFVNQSINQNVIKSRIELPSMTTASCVSLFFASVSMRGDSSSFTWILLLLLLLLLLRATFRVTREESLSRIQGHLQGIGCQDVEWQDC